MPDLALPVIVLCDQPGSTGPLVCNAAPRLTSSIDLHSPRRQQQRNLMKWTHGLGTLIADVTYAVQVFDVEWAWVYLLSRLSSQLGMGVCNKLKVLFGSAYSKCNDHLLMSTMSGSALAWTIKPNQSFSIK